MLGRDQESGTSTSPRKGRQDGRFSSPPQNVDPSSSFVTENIGIGEGLGSSRVRSNIDLRPFLNKNSGFSSNQAVLGAPFSDINTARPRFSNQFSKSFQSVVRNTNAQDNLGQNLRPTQVSDPLRRRPKSSQVPRFPPVTPEDFQNKEFRRFLLEQNRFPTRFSGATSDQRLDLLRRIIAGFRK